MAGMPKNAVAIGVDIGGTSVKLGLVDSKGRILARETFQSGRSSGRETILAGLSACVGRLAAEARRRKLPLAGIGIGAPGPIDVERGIVYFFPNLPGWKNTPLKKILEKKLHMPVRLDNDANAMALGEFTFGAGKGVSDGLALTLGTGVGGGIVLGGKLFHGPAYSAAEIGHLVINEDGPRCGCGNNGCIETYVGNSYFAREVRRRLDAGEKSVLKKWLAEGKELSPYLTWQAAQKGDAFACRFWEETGAHLGTALAGLVNILNPSLIVLGGGIAQDKPRFLASVVRAIRRKAFPIAARSVKVVPAKLGTDAGIIGSAALVLV